MIELPYLHTAQPELKLSLPASLPACPLCTMADLAAAKAASLRSWHAEGNRWVAVDRKLKGMGLVRSPVPGDGNCQFHALIRSLRGQGVNVFGAHALRVQAASHEQEQCTCLCKHA